MMKLETKKQMDVMVDVNLSVSFKAQSESEQQAYIEALQQLDPMAIQNVFITLLQSNGTVLTPSRVHDWDIKVIDAEEA